MRAQLGRASRAGARARRRTAAGSSGGATSRPSLPAREQPLEARDHARDDRAAAAHRLEQHHAEARPLAGRAEDVGRGVVARAVPVDAARPVHGRGDLGREPPLRSSARSGPSPTTQSRTWPSRARQSRSNASSMMPRPLRGSKRPRKSTTGSPLARSSSSGLRRRARSGPRRCRSGSRASRTRGSSGRAARCRRPRRRCGRAAGCSDGARGRVHEVAHAPGREDRVVGADADRPVGQHERREHEEARVVGRVDVHDVELPRGEEPPQLPRARAGARCAASASRCRRAASRRPCARARRRRSPSTRSSRSVVARRVRQRGRSGSSPRGRAPRG